MPQTYLQWIRGYAHLIYDILFQKMHFHPNPQHPVFHQKDSLKGQTAIVTGANSGIGFETARKLASLGAHVIFACRNLQTAQAAVDAILNQQPTASLAVMHLDLSSLESVRHFATTVNTSPRPIVHMLVLNAGVMAASQSYPETHLKINHIAHALLTILLLPALHRAPRSRVVFVSSMTVLVSDLRWNDLQFAKRSYNWMTAYGNSKLMMILFMLALHKRLHLKSGISVNALHPGDSPSEVSRNLGWIWYLLHQKVGPYVLLSNSQCALTSVYAAAAEDFNESGSIIHRIDQPLHIPPHLITDDQVELAWRATVELAGITDRDLKYVKAMEMSNDLHVNSVAKDNLTDGHMQQHHT